MRIVAVAALAGLAACGHLRTAPVPAPPPAAPQSAATVPPADSAEGAAALVAGAHDPPDMSGDNAAPDGAASVATNCVPPEAKTKPKSKPRPKAVRKEVPPPLPSAPVAAGTLPGGVVDAQVRRLSVSVMSILGKRVKDPQGGDVGRVVDILADADGRVRVAIIDFGGFLGVGDRRIAVDWPLLRFNADGGEPSLLLSVARDKLKSAPEYKDNPQPQTLMEPLSSAAERPGTAAAIDNPKR